jgi:hypothetical protein
MITQAYVSPTLETTFGENFRTLWQLEKYSDPSKPAVFFGLYTKADLDILVSHKSYSIVVWGGGDMRAESLREVSKLVNSGKSFTWSYPGEFSKILTAYNIRHKQIYVPVKDYSKFDIHPLGDKIYVYRGVKGTRSDYFKWNEVIVPLMNTIGEEHFIYTDNIEVSELVEDYYKKCFVYVKPTPRGGCTAMFELGHMGRRTIGVGHTGLPNFTEYGNFSQLVRLVKSESKKIGKTPLEIREATQSVFIGREWLDLDFWKK